MRILLWLCAAALASCGPRSGSAVPEKRAFAELVETVPVEVPLNRADVPDTADVWPQMIDGAKRSLAIAQFYASEAEGTTSALTPVVGAVLRAAARGVRVRFLADALFASKYPAVLEDLRGHAVEVRTIDASKHYGGVMHAKYFVVDDDECFVGSQNFDWRSLAHTYELGVRMRSPGDARAVREIFDYDWALAGGDPRPAPAAGASSIVASPKGWLARDNFELDAILDLLAKAREEACIHVLLYSTQMRDKSTFTLLDDALRATKKRGVRIRMLVSDWSSKPGSHERASIESLAAAGIEIRVVTIPKWSGGEIPFARVAHAKFLVVDGAAAWLGSSNWEGDYFLKTRNVGVVLRGGSIPRTLASSFDAWWASPYAAALTSLERAAPP